MPAFLCSVPLPVSRPLFLFCRMLSGLFVCLFPGIECRCSSFCSRVFSPALFLCPVPRGIPRFPFFFSPASDAGVLPPLWRGKVLPFTVQSRDHLATITDIYVPSFPYVHSPAFNAGFLRRSFRRLMLSGLLGGRVDRRTPLFINLTHAYVCIF
mgnify:CR=1 FL=1